MTFAIIFPVSAHSRCLLRIGGGFLSEPTVPSEPDLQQGWKKVLWPFQSSVIRYCLTGGVSFCIFVLISSVPLFDARFPPALASGCAVLIAGIANFLGHHWFTFRSERAIRSTLARYCGLLLFNAGGGA